MKVLLGIDDDPVLPEVLAAMEWSVDLSGWSQVVALHVVPKYPFLLVGTDAPVGQTGKSLLDRVGQGLSRLPVDVQVVLASGDPSQEIVRVADETEADLIVIGALGERPDFLLGSVSQRVVSTAGTDVLVVRKCAAEAAERRRSFRALLAVDGSLGSEAAIESFARKIRARNAAIRVVHVLESMPSLWLAGREHESLFEAGDRTAVEVLVRAKEALESRGLEVECECRRGSPTAQILDAARDFESDLIVMGSQGHSGIREMMLGSTTHRVLRHAPCTVLCARGWAFESGALSRQWTSDRWEPEVGMA